MIGAWEEFCGMDGWMGMSRAIWLDGMVFTMHGALIINGGDIPRQSQGVSDSYFLSIEGGIDG